MDFPKQSLIEYNQQEGVAMNVTTKLKMDLSKPDFGLSVDAVQGDAYSRSVSIALYNGILPWHIPENVAVAVRYAKPDCTKGYYDTLPDGESAWSYQENILTVQLAPQMLTVAGQVKAQIELIRSTHILSTFSLTVHVEANPAAGVLNSEDYSNWLQWILRQSDEHAQQVQLSAQTASQASESASLAAENASSSATSANTAALDALTAADSVDANKKEIEAIAADVKAIISGNEAYTKQECDSRYSPVIHQSTRGKTILLADSAAASLQNLKLYGKTIQNSTPAPDAPVPLESVGENVKVTVCGKNLFDPTAFTNYSVNTDGTLSANNSAVLTGFIPVMNTYVSVFGKLVEGRTEVTSQFRIAQYDNNKNFIRRTLPGTKTTITADVSNCAYIRLCFFNSEFDTDSVQMEWGNTATEFEPYSGSSVTFSTPNGLPGIPVASGGNYTDENGQQWLCDEVDFEKGTYVQRVQKRTVENARTKTWGKLSNGVPYIELHNPADKYNGNTAGGLSNVYPWASTTTNGVFRTFIDTVLVCDERFTDLNTGVALLTELGFEALIGLRESTETALSAEELTAYAALHTNYPNTTVFNDGGAGMEVKYVADTKRYIDQKFDQLATVLVNNI